MNAEKYERTESSLSGLFLVRFNGIRPFERRWCFNTSLKFYDCLQNKQVVAGNIYDIGDSETHLINRPLQW